MDNVNVLITVPVDNEHIERLKGDFPQLIVDKRTIRKPEEFNESLLADVEVMFAHHILPDPAITPNLQWVALYSAGVDRIVDQPLFAETNIPFTNTSGIHAVPTAEYVFSHIIGFSQNIRQMLYDQSSMHWPDYSGRMAMYSLRELRGSTLGIVGYGSIGREVARIGDAFGMHVLAVKNNLRVLEDHSYCVPGTGDPHGDLPDRLYPPEALLSMLAECDYVVITVPLTEQTYHMMDAAAFNAMKKTAYLVNISRGKVVDEQALIPALKSGHIAGAALDVFETEPLPDTSPLWQLNNVVISPHVSALSTMYKDRAVEVFAANLDRYLNREPLFNVVNRDRGY